MNHIETLDIRVAANKLSQLDNEGIVRGFIDPQQVLQIALPLIIKAVASLIGGGRKEKAILKVADQMDEWGDPDNGDVLGAVGKVLSEVTKVVTGVEEE